jgi:adenine-specific DNA-methyltransferase
VAAWLVPSEFMQTDYGAAVRYYLTHRVKLIRVHRFDHLEPQFENVEVLPAVIVFRNREPKPEDEVLMSTGGTLSSPVRYGSTLVADLRRVEAKWSVPAAEEPYGLAAEFKVGDLFTVRRGIATGANEFFIIKREDAEQLGIPAVAVRPILPKARALPADIIERMEDGFPALTSQLCLIDCDLPQEEIRSRYPRFAEYLEKAKSSDLLERNLVRRRKPWYRQEQREPAHFLCTYMGRGRGGMPPIRFIWNKSDAVVSNTYLMLYPRPALAQFLLANPEVEGELFDLLRETARNTMRESWRIHAGGLVKIEPGELLQVRLSAIPAWIRQVVELRLQGGP